MSSIFVDLLFHFLVCIIWSSFQFSTSKQFMAHREFIRTYLIAKQIDIHRIKFFKKTEVYNRKMITIIKGLEIIFLQAKFGVFIFS